MRTAVTAAGVLGLALVLVGSPVESRLALNIAQPDQPKASQAPALTSHYAATEGPAPAIPDQDLNGVVQQYCVMCHGGPQPVRDLSLESFDVAKIDQNAEVGEKMSRKLRAGMMPAFGLQRD